MSKEYLDKQGNPIKKGFYNERDIPLQICYISRDGRGGWKCEYPGGDFSILNPNVKLDFVPLNINDVSLLSSELSNKTNFIQSKLEQLAQSEQSPQLDSGRGKKPKHQRGLSAYSISNPVKGLGLTRYPIHPEH